MSNFIHRYTDTNATFQARNYYSQAVFAPKNAGAYRVVDLTKRTAYVVATIFLSLPLINIIAERVFRALGCHTLKAKSPQEAKATNSGSQTVGSTSNAVEVNEGSLANRVNIVLTSQKLPGEGLDAGKDTYYVRIKATQGEVGSSSENQNMAFVFCVDVSGSMGGERIKSVLEAMNGFLGRTEARVSNGAKINLAVVKYDHNSEIALQSTVLSADSTQIKATLNSELQANGNTDIIKGLQLASEVLSNMQSVNKAASHVLVFMTDGQDPNVTEESLVPIQKRLAESGATLLALGISNAHDVKIMQKVTADNRPAGSEGAFSSVYKFIGTGAGSITVAEAIDGMFSELSSQLVSNILFKPPQLKGVSMKVLTMNPASDGFHLGGLSQNQTSTKVVRIVVDKNKGLPNSDFGFTLVDGDLSDGITQSISGEEASVLIDAMKGEILEAIDMSDKLEVSKENKIARFEKVEEMLKQSSLANSQDADLSNLIRMLQSTLKGLKGGNNSSRGFKDQDDLTRMRRARCDD